MEENKEVTTEFVIHVKDRQGGFQIRKPCIVCTYIKTGEHGLMARCLQNRAIQHGYVARRIALPDEVETENHSYRVHFILYDDWEKLIDDERKFVQDENWFEQLSTLQKQFPQFKKQEEVLQK